MNTYKKSYLKELAAKCAETEVYVYQGERHTFHGDFIKGLDTSLDNLPDEVECNFSEMDEEEYNATVLANCGERADFADWYGDKDAKVLVIALSEFFEL